MNRRIYWLARVLWPDLVDIAYFATACDLSAVD